MIGCTELTPEHFASIAAAIDFSVNIKRAKDSDPDKNIDVKVEKEIRKFINDIGSLKNKPKAVHSADVDCFGSKSDNRDTNRTTAILSDDETFSSMDEA